MTTDEYLKSCSDIPQLPRSWRWEVSDKEYTSVKTEKKYLRVSVFIVDPDGNVLGHAAAPFAVAFMQRMINSGMADQELSKVFKSAYNSLYLDRRVSFCKVLGIDPTN